MKRLAIVTVFALFLLAGCHEGQWHWVTPVPPIPTIEPQVLPTVTPMPEVIPAEETGELVPDPTPVPPCEEIKGNINRAGDHIYFTHESINYKNVKIDEAKGEQWFCSEEDAIAAGWRKAQR